MDRAAVDRALLALVRSEGDERDLIRLCQAALARGVTLTPLEAFVIWWWYSGEHAADWLVMDDHGIDRALARFLATFGAGQP